MHGHYRSREKGANLPSYCPLDLFSGEERRICKALGNLWDDWVDSKGCANNLRVFVHGTMVKPCDVRAIAICHSSDNEITIRHPWMFYRKNWS